MFVVTQGWSVEVARFNTLGEAMAEAKRLSQSNADGMGYAFGVKGGDGAGKQPGNGSVCVYGTFRNGRQV